MGADMKILEDFRSLIEGDLSDFTGVSRSLREYESLSILGTNIEKSRKALKAEIFAMPRVKKILDQSEKTVREFSTSATVPIIKHKGYQGVVQINPGASYVDLDSLKDALGVSDQKWLEAIGESTKSRNPNFTLKIVR